MSRLLVLVFLIGLVVTGRTQELHHAMRHYTAVDGLPQSQVSAVVEDKNGYLWIGTEGGGLARFDGRDFKVFTTLDGLLTNFIADLKIDSKQNIWIHHLRGLTRYDGLTFTKFQAPRPSNSYKYLVRIFEVSDTIFACSADMRISKIYGDSVYYWNRPLVEDVRILGASQAGNGALIFFLENREVLILDRGKKIFIPTNIKPGKYLRMFRKGDDVLIRSDDRELFLVNVQKKKVEKVDGSIEYQKIFQYDKSGDSYWAQDLSNLFKVKKEKGEIEVDTILKDVEVNRVFKDSENNFWIATDGSGLYKYYLQDFDRCTSDHLRGVMAILVDSKGASWVGTMSKGLWKIKKGKISSYTEQEGSFRNSIRCIKEAPDGTIWVGSGYGLGKYNRESDSFSWITSEEGLSNSSIVNIDFDKKGGMWVGTAGGLNYYDGKSFTQYTTKQGLKSNLISSMAYSDRLKTLFVGTELGINTVKEGKVGIISIPELENTMILSLHTYRDSLILIGSGGSGAMVFNPDTYEKKSITTRDGLTSDFVYFITHDEDDKLWIGMEKGISRIKLSDHLGIQENLHYDYENGLTGVETNQNAYYLDENNKYFGLIDGLYEFNDLGKQNKKSFGLHLTDVEIFYGDYSARDYADSLMGFFKIPFNPTLPHDKSHITFHFNKVDKQYPKSVKFKYFLQNFDMTWSQPSSSTQVTYSNLPPGDYVFRVMATNKEGSWSEDKIAYPFTVQAPFYQTASFIAGLIIFVAGSITLLMYLRVRQRVKKMIDTERIRMQELEGLRKEIARDFHDEMGNQLTRIINYVSLMKLNGNGNNGHSDLYSKVEQSAKFLYTGTRDFIWSIDPVNDELSKLFVHIRDFGEKLFEEKNIHFRAFDNIKENVKLPNGFSREANLIFKEAMTNAFKYSEAVNVSLALSHIDDHFEMKFEDDGIGFNAAYIEKMNGLKNIRERAERIGAVLRITSQKDQGTSIALEFKLTKTYQHGTTL